MDLSLDAKKMINESKNLEELEETIAFVDDLLKNEEIYPTELQWTILINHLNEMISRKEENRSIPEVDPAMFSEVSLEALKIAGKVVDKIGNLSMDEKYVLSIHFESAKLN